MADSTANYDIMEAAWHACREVSSLFSGLATPQGTMMYPKTPPAPSTAMDSAVSILTSEHASYTLVLKALVGHLDYARAHPNEPKLQIFATGLGFIDTFVDYFHHPKEDEFLFRALRKRSREADEVLCELQFDHAHANSTLEQLKIALDGVQSGGITEFNAFAAAMEHYTRAQFVHMDLEERVVIPFARRLVDDDTR